MRKVFKFKLEGLLKFRKLKEKNIKIELGKINQDIMNLKNEIVELKSKIEKSYTLQEKTLDYGKHNFPIEIFPNYIQAQRENIRNKEVLIHSLQKKYSEKVDEMKIAMGETKVTHKIREKKIKEYKTKLEKKQWENIEEMLRMRSYQLKKIAREE